MPLARIVTRFPEDTLAASEYFRSQGYTVEVISPGDFRVTPAALEIKLDKCTPQQALLRAQQAVRNHQSGLSETEQAAPVGSAEEDRVPIAWDITGRPVEFAAPEETPERRKSTNSFGAALVSMLDRAWNSVDAGLTRTWRSATSVFRNWAQARADERELQREAKLAREREELQREGMLAQKAEASRREQDQSLRKETIHQGTSHIAAEQETSRAVGLQREAQAAEERERQRAAEREAELVQRQEEQRLAAEREAQQRERARIEAERQAAEQERARLQDERQAAEEERARVNALHEQMIAAQLRERDRNELPRPVEPLTQEAQANTASTPLPATSSAPPTVLPPELPVDQPPLRVLERFRPACGDEWKKAFAAAGAAALLLAAGIIAYANRRPASPLSNSDVARSQSVQQQSPFGAATVTPPVQAVKPAPTTTATAQHAPVRHTTRTASTSHRSATSRHSARRLRRSFEEDDEVAEDQVVVRHYSQAVPVAKSHTTAGLKKYSDTD